MSIEEALWERLADEIAEGVRQDLSGVSTQRPRRIPGAVRVRGAAKPPQSSPITIVVAVLQDEASPEQVRNRLQERVGQAPLDIYYVVKDKQGSALEARELNPDDPEHGRRHRLILSNLKPDFVIVPAGQALPHWCNDKIVSNRESLVEW